jgi:hypothetical protein
VLRFIHDLRQQRRHELAEAGGRARGDPRHARRLAGGGSCDLAQRAGRGGSLSGGYAYFAEQGIVVRAGQHCAPMALEAIGAPAGTIRISFGPFNTEGEVEEIARAVDRARR